MTASEFNKVTEHPVAGVQILHNIGFLEAILSTIKHHHEHFSGGG
ncbi:HD domain-containing phosphohydrolase [Paradesulfitobacterium aromaticivorans]